MPRTAEILTRVWREACLHLDLAETTRTITRLLAERLPLERLLVRTIDADRHAVLTLGVGSTVEGAAARLERTERSSAEMKRLLAWCRRGEIEHQPVDRTNASSATLALPLHLDVETLIVPLPGGARPPAVLILCAKAGRRFDADDIRFAGSLLEPFAAILENDHRLRELTALREAAEADKRSLLTRLGREQLSDTVVGADSGLRPVMQRVELVARSDAPVLILGETGSGKEVIARHIHTGSPRGSGPFIRVNCGAIPSDLIDSELFGHEKGAFTGAAAQRRGWFERADEGTLFLDEIGELPPQAQVRLLRVLQDGTFERVGGEEGVKVDVRIVAATHRDLAAMVREGRFREDLWYRIAVFPIVLPPLRERRDDIPALAEHFAQRAAKRFGLRLQTPTGYDIALLRAYDWPGNVRELASVLDRAAILGDGERLEVAKALGVTSQAEPAPPRAMPPSLSASTSDSLDDATRRHIEAALAACKGRIEGPFGAAERLGINPHTLRARMRRLRIDWRAFRSPRKVSGSG